MRGLRRQIPRLRCDGGVKLIEILKHADSLQLGCVTATSASDNQVYDVSVDVPEVDMDRSIYNQPTRKSKTQCELQWCESRICIALMGQ